jgi:hypothetical protein
MGSFRFLLGLNMALDFKGYGLQNNYYYIDNQALTLITFLTLPILY